jgi:hypothetical protein
MPDREPKKRSVPDAEADSKEHPHHIADEPVTEAEPLEPEVKSPTTDTGLPVEEQIHKEWDPNKDGGLPIPLTPVTAEKAAK